MFRMGERAQSALAQSVQYPRSIRWEKGRVTLLLMSLMRVRLALVVSAHTIERWAVAGLDRIIEGAGNITSTC